MEKLKILYMMVGKKPSKFTEQFTNETVKIYALPDILYICNRIL